MTQLRILLASLLCFAAATLGAAAEPGDDSGALLGRTRVALGGDVWNRVKILHATMALNCGGLDGLQESWTRPARGYYTEHYSLGPDRGARGWNGHVAWSLDGTGRVRQLDRENSSELRGTAFWSSFAFLFVDRTGAVIELEGERREGNHLFDLVRITPAGLRPMELWLDADTALPARIVQHGQPDLVVSFADYRPVDGLKLPFRVTISDGLPQNEQRLDMQWITIEDGQSDDLFAMPPPSPSDYSFPDSTRRSSSILTATGSALLVDVMIDGHGPYPFALDTGAGNTLDATLAEEIGLTVSGKFSGRGAGEQPADLGLTRAGTLAIGDVKLRDPLFRVLPLQALAPAGKLPYRGLLGYEIFDRFVVSIDQDLREVDFIDPAVWRYDGDAKPVEFRLHGRVPVVSGAIDLVPGQFTLDTGQANSLTLYRPFMVRMGIEHKYVPKMSVIVGEGIGGPIRAEVTRGQRLSVGNASMTSPVIYLSLQKYGAFTDPDLAGNIGGGMFLHYNTIFDYSHRRVYFEHSSAYGEGDSLGLMSVKRVHDGLQVLSVLPGGPVDEAGLKPDDLIETINAKSAVNVDYIEIQHMFRKPAGTRITMTVRSEGHLRDIVIVLAEAI